MKPEEKALAKRRRQRNLVTALGVLALALLFVASFKGYGDLRLGRSREAQLQGEIETSEARIKALEDKVVRLREDPAMLEQFAREELLMARPGEVVIVLPEKTVLSEKTGADEPAREGDG